MSSYCMRACFHIDELDTFCFIIFLCNPFWKFMNIVIRLKIKILSLITIFYLTAEGYSLSNCLYQNLHLALSGSNCCRL